MLGGTKTNFRDNIQVAEDLRYALLRYKDYEISVKGGNEKAAISFLKQAGQLGYSAMEHAYKNYLYHYYTKQREEGLIDEETYQDKLDFLTEVVWFKSDGVSRYANHKDLMDEFCLVVKNPKVDLKLILKEAQDGNNDVKHDGEIPDAKKLLAALLEMKKFFLEYISVNAQFPELGNISYDKDSALLNIRTSCDNFSDLFTYVLVVGPGNQYSDVEAADLFSIKWDLIIDFDPYTQITGLQEKYIRLNQHGVASVRKLDVSENSIFIRSVDEAHWIIANGMDGQEETISPTGRNWRTRHGRHLNKMLMNFKSAYVKPIKMFVSESIAEEFLAPFIDICSESFYYEKEDNYVGIQTFLLNGKEKLAEYDEAYMERVSISDSEFIDSLKTGIIGGTYDFAEKILPGLNAEEHLSRDFENRLNNFCEIVYDGIEKNDPLGTQEEFYHGERPIYWAELHSGIDIKRKEYEQRHKGVILELLVKQPYSYYEVAYKPGFGGTTFMRRMAWDFHAFYPTLILSRYEKEDSDILRQFTRKLSKPLFILIDSNYVKKEIAEAVVSDLKAWNASHLVIYINRIRKNSLQRNSSTIFSIPELDEKSGEISQFIKILMPYVTKDVCKERLESFVMNPAIIEERSPFYLALSAYDEDFVGIRQYITNFIKVISGQYRNFLVYLAIADYINKPIDIEFFGNILHSDMPEATMQDNTAFSSLVTYIHTRDRQTFCKLKFPAVGGEILRQATNGFQAENENTAVFINLTDYIIEFINSSNITEEIPNKNIVDFLVELLITRHEDLDSIKPQFSDMITHIGTGVSSVFGNKWSQEGQAAVERIFQALVKTYRNDTHFKAHLARFKSYIQEDYNGALIILDEAIEEDASHGKVDFLLLHMKAMVYAAKITVRLIPDIKRAKLEEKAPEIIEAILIDIRFNLHEAEKLFEEVRKSQTGIAGHVSDIKLCINVIDMGRFLEGTDTATFLSDHHDDWYMNLADRANILFDECLEYKEELDPILNKADIEKIDEVGKDISVIRDGIDKTIELYKSYLANANDRTRPLIRRHLARAYEERNGRMDWSTIAELMTENIKEDPNNESNIRIWFRAILHTKDEDPLETLRRAVILLNAWISNDERNLEAHYYRYILTFIEAVETISGAESRLRDYQQKMKDLAYGRPNKTSIRYWLGKNGRGIERLIHKHNFPLSDPVRANQMLYPLRGRISSKYANDRNAYIDVFKTDVFFNPSGTDGKISEQNKNQPVVFGVGFSLDGPRAYNSSIELYTGEQVIPKNELEPLKRGTRVRCQVLNNKLEYYINVKILGYDDQQGSIPVKELAYPYNSQNRPKVNGPLIDAYVIQRKSITSGGMDKLIWELSMNPPKNERLSTGIGELLKTINVNIPEENDHDSEIPPKAGMVILEEDEVNTEIVSAEKVKSSKKEETEVDLSERDEIPEKGKVYIMKQFSFSNKALRGKITMGDIKYTVMVPSVTKKTYDKVQKGNLKVRIVQINGTNIVAKIEK